MMGHLNSFSASGVGNLNKNFPKIQMPGGLPGGGMFKLRFDWYITHRLDYALQKDNEKFCRPLTSNPPPPPPATKKIVSLNHSILL